uniref:Uncharacterized protein n=1 Tax=Mycena chlorophos TaxID=658473 RepID=A0ABQ0KVV2_MYCCL|nr:predicted protein [Mycena chlorophos]
MTALDLDLHLQFSASLREHKHEQWRPEGSFYRMGDLTNRPSQDVAFGHPGPPVTPMSGAAPVALILVGLGLDEINISSRSRRDITRLYSALRSTHVVHLGKTLSIQAEAAEKPVRWCCMECLLLTFRSNLGIKTYTVAEERFGMAQAP